MGTSGGRVIRQVTAGFSRVGMLGVALLMGLSSVFVLPPNRAKAFSGDGDGTVGSPYQISTCAELQEIALDLDAAYVLEGSVDCDGVSFSPLSSLASPFEGTLDGQGNEISNVTVTSGGNFVGIFGAVYNAVITDVRLDTIAVTGAATVGALAGNAALSQLTYIHARDVTVVGTTTDTGGLVGALGGASIEKSYIENVDVTGDDRVGGLVGYAVGPAEVSDSYVSGSVSGTGDVGGVVGAYGTGPGIAQQVYADVTFTGAGSQPIGAVGSGPMIGSTFIADNSHLSTSTAPPLNTWDFGNIWYVRPGKYPGIRPLTAPQLLCAAPTRTDTSVTASCTTEPVLDGGTQWEIELGYDNEAAREPAAIMTGALFTSTMSGLLPGTDYAVYFRYVDAIGTSEWGKVSISTSGSSDVDGDNYTNKEEFDAPNFGDADNDGTEDYTQPHVTGLSSTVSGNHVVLKSPCTDNFNVMIGGESSVAPDGFFDYPAGLLGFVVRGCTLGSTVPIEIYFYGSYNPADYVLRKSNGTVYSTVPGAVMTQQTIGGESVLKLSYSITDGSAYDDDGIADGNIVDPVGLALTASAPSVPNTGIGR